MKNFSLILAMLFLAFTVEAQNVERSRKSKERKTTNTSVRKSSSNSSKAKIAKAPARSSSSATKSKNSSVRSSVSKKAKKTSNSSAVQSSRSSKSRSASASTVSGKSQAGRSNSARAANATSSKSRSASSVANRSSQSRKVKAASSTSRARASGAREVYVHRNGDSRSVYAYAPKTGAKYDASRRVYTSNNGRRVKRHVPKVRYTYQSIDYRRTHYPYNRPILRDIFWNVNMYHSYRLWYPDFKLWYYPNGYRIHTISAYDSYSYIGEVARIYGRVSEVWFSRETGEYYLYIGGQYPYQDFTVILDSSDARRFSRDPLRYFTNRHLAVTGLVSLYEDKPEMLIRNKYQSFRARQRNGSQRRGYYSNEYGKMESWEATR